MRREGKSHTNSCKTPCNESPEPARSPRQKHRLSRFNFHALRENLAEPVLALN